MGAASAGLTDIVRVLLDLGANIEHAESVSACAIVGRDRNEGVGEEEEEGGGGGGGGGGDEKGGEVEGDEGQKSTMIKM